MELNGLSIDQAPPIFAPLRFYLTAPLFAILAGFLIFFSDSTVLMSRYSTDSIVITHALTIGFLGFVMLGSLTQMLPVLAGVQIPKVNTVSKIAHLFLVFGTLSMLFGLMSESTFFNTSALILLGVGFTMIVTVIAMAILKVKNFNATVKAMSVSLIFASLTFLMGLFLLLTYIDVDYAQYRNVIANVHSVWGIFGFAGILIIGVTFQVLPMFYVAPRFKQFCKKRVVLLISVGLIIWLLTSLFAQSYSIVGKLWIAVFFWAFATTVWKKMSARRRPISDVTVWYWRVSSIALTLGSFLWIFDEYFKHEYIVMVAILLGGGFILSIMIGMLYKIIPFLVWFHLNAMGYMTIPTMNEMINKNLARAQFFLFIASLIGFIFAFYIPILLKIAALSFILSMVILQYNVIAPVLIYNRIKKTKPDFDMSAFKV
ncbi:hypothetical protein [Sulfurimonas sp.]|uniref:hypothetical protein n=1 Tax=Sulfurimonas sp. TaxID=2022749 RepID=UPI0025E7B4F5|nr:hypothetical protein [Sulfurimonas sp.]